MYKLSRFVPASGAEVCKKSAKFDNFAIKNSVYVFKHQN